MEKKNIMEMMLPTKKIDIVVRSLEIKTMAATLATTTYIMIWMIEKMRMQKTLKMNYYHQKKEKKRRQKNKNNKDNITQQQIKI